MNVNHLKIFGLGLGLILICFSLFHHLHLHLGLLRMAFILVFLLFVIDRALRWPWVYAIVYGLIFVVSLFQFLKQPPSAGVMICDAASVVLVGVAVVNPVSLAPIYNVWMKAAHFLGVFITGLVLTSVYFFMFTPVRILLRLVGKDHLERKWDRKQQSYWQKRTRASAGKERYHQQF